MVVEHSVVIRVTSSEDLQLVSTRPALHRLLMICKAYDVVANILVLIPCTAGTAFRCINEKLGAETRDLAMTYKLAVAAVGLCRHAVRIGGGFSSCCLVSTAVVRQQFVDREGGVFYVKMAEMFKKVTGAEHVHVFHHQLRAVEDNADGNGFNTSVRHAAEEAFLRFAGNAVDKILQRTFRAHQRVAKHHHRPHREQSFGSVRRDLSGVT